MTPEEKVQQLFDEEENSMFKTDYWITVARVKRNVISKVEGFISIYKNSALLHDEENQKRISYWESILTILKQKQ